MNNEYRSYEVTAMPKFPAWDEHEGYKYEISARSKSEAIKYARRQAFDDGHTIGRVVYFSAKEMESQQ